MTNNREEIIATITKLLASIAEEEKPQTPAPAPPADVVEMLTVKECCETVKGLNEYTVRQLVTRGEIPHVRCGQGKRGKILVPKTALINYFNGVSRNVERGEHNG